MAKVLILSPQLYIQGQVNLFQGDAWVIPAQIVDSYNNLNIPTNLSTAVGVTAYFPNTAGTAVPVAGTITDAAQGMISIAVLPSVTQNLLAPEPISCYVQVSGLIAAGGVISIPTQDQPLVITAPAFIS